MSGTSRKKDQSREKILSSAGALVREKGISGTSVSEVMGGAGMTVGGFYAHFPSKESLVAETLSSSLRESRCRLETAAEDLDGADWVESVTRSYLSRAHRDNPSSGCPLPASAADVACSGEEVRLTLASELGSTSDALSAHLLEAGVDDPHSEALALIALMVGGLTLSRALNGTPLSDEMLKSCREHIARSIRR